jgi:putative tryptophan/tyrosine transport system substrate-binding protein
MRRREFITLLGGAAASWPLTVRAQQAKRLPVIAMVYSIGSVAEMAGVDPLGVNMRAFERELRDLGWIDGRTVTIERQSTEGQPQRAVDILAEVVARRPDVILLGGARWLHEAALRATRTIPIVAPFGEDHVPAGLISSLARPGGNLTGVTRATGPEFYGKASQFLRDAAPGIRRLAFLAPRETLDAFQAVAPSVGITVIPVQVDTSEQLDASFANILRERADAMLVPSGPIFLRHAKRIAEFAVENKLPALFGMRQSAEAGGLMSYGPSIVVLYRQMARQVDRILKGVRPEDIPTERPTTFELVINAKAATALGLAIPPAFLVLADEVIE